jgi:hypothetical protein
MAFNFGQAFGQGTLGALGGASSGALIGSAVPGIGTAIGAGLGGLLGLLAGGASGASMSQNNGFEQSPNKYSPEQQKALNQTLAIGQQNLQNPTAGFDPISQDARRQFNTQTVPGLAERFTALGGGQRSSAFQGALGNAGANLESQLAALKAQYGLQNQRNALDQLQTGLTPQQEWIYFGQQPGFGQQLFEAGTGALGTYTQGGGTFGGLTPQQGSLTLSQGQAQQLAKILQYLKGM